jgi:hypothetical protein
MPACALAIDGGVKRFVAREQVVVRERRNLILLRHALCLFRAAPSAVSIRPLRPWPPALIIETYQPLLCLSRCAPSRRLLFPRPLRRYRSFRLFGIQLDRNDQQQTRQTLPLMYHPQFFGCFVMPHRVTQHSIDDRADVKFNDDARTRAWRSKTPVSVLRACSDTG